MTRSHNDSSDVMDENTRRYYLDAMGIQCWQPLKAESNDSVSDSMQQNSSAQEPSQKVVQEGVVQEKILKEKDIQEEIMQYEIAQNSDSLQIGWSQLEENVQGCIACDLHKQRKQALLGSGNTSADLMFVLLSPSSSDDAAGKICSGEEGGLLKKMLAAIKIEISDVYITSLLKCSVTAARTISPKEIQQCNKHLQQQIQSVKPKVLVVLGETAAQCLLKQTAMIDDMRDNINPWSQEKNKFPTQINSIPLFVSYSPDELLQQAENKRKAWLDLQQLEKHYQSC